jgi:cytochrome c biogenesis factor
MSLVAVLAEAMELESHEESETFFFFAGILLAVFAVVVATIGIRNPDLSDSATRTILRLGVALVVLAMTAMVVIST